MDQEKIGKFIAERRESKKLTQKDLAVQLGVTNKAISKWENGHGMPDYSLFQSLCKLLDISVSELLNGEAEEKSKTKVEDGITNYIKYKEKTNRKKTIYILIAIIVLFVVSLFIIHFFNSYKKISVYELSGNSENFKYENGLLIKSNIKNILELGKLTSDTITSEQIINASLSVKIDENYYFISNVGNGEVISENDGYGEYLNDRKKEYTPQNLYVIVWYKVNDEVKTEILKVSNKRLLINDKIYYKKQDSITDMELNKPINLNRFDKVSICENHFISQGFKKDNAALIKELSEYEYIKFNCYTDNLYYSYHYEKDGLRIKSFNYNYDENSNISTMKFDIYDKKNNVRGSLIYDFYRKKITGRDEIITYKSYIEHAIELFEKYKIERDE